MKIIELRAENIKNLKAIEINADGKSVTLSGKNEVGKSSVIDAIAMALTGQMVERPIKDGETRGEVVVNLGEYIVKRIWTEAGNRLEVTTKEGAKYPSPQTLLNQIIGKLSFDPLAFKDMEKKAQRDLLVKLIGLDFADLDAERIRTYDNRTLQNKVLSGAEARLVAMAKPVEGLPAEEISIAAEMDKIALLEDKRKSFLNAIRDQQDINQKITEYQKTIENEKSNQKSRDIAYDHEIMSITARTEQRIKDLQELIKQAEKDDVRDIEETKKRFKQLAVDIASQINAANHNIEVYQKSLADIKVPEETPISVIDSARAGIKEIESKNIAIRKAKEYATLKAEVIDAKDKSEAMTKKIDSIDADKSKRIQEAQYPVPGLSVTDDSVVYNGIPFSQAADGVKIKVSTAIAMKLNPKLRVIFIKEASLLDSDGMTAINEMAKENDYQLWKECVTNDKEITIRVEE